MREGALRTASGQWISRWNAPSRMHGSGRRDRCIAWRRSALKACGTRHYCVFPLVLLIGPCMLLRRRFLHDARAIRRNIYPSSPKYPTYLVYWWLGNLTADTSGEPRRHQASPKSPPGRVGVRALGGQMHRICALLSSPSPLLLRLQFNGCKSQLTIPRNPRSPQLAESVSSSKVKVYWATSSW